MITDEDIEMVLFHPLFRQRVNEVLRRHGLLPEVVGEDDVAQVPRSGLPLEALGIYITLQEACEKYGLAVAEIHDAVAGDRVRWRTEGHTVQVEQDTVEQWLKARRARIRAEERTRKVPQTVKKIGLHIESDRRRDPHVTGPAALRGNDRVGWPLPKLPRPKGAVTMAEAGFILGIGRMTCGPYVSEGKLESSGPGWVTLDSVERYGKRIGRKLKALPGSEPITQNESLPAA